MRNPPLAVSSRLTVKSRRSLGAAAITAPVPSPRRGKTTRRPSYPGRLMALPLATFGSALRSTLGPLGTRPVILGALAPRAMVLAATTALRAAATTTTRQGPRRDPLLQLLQLEIQVLHTSLL